VIQANLLAATSTQPGTSGAVYNVALGGSTTLLELHRIINAKLEAIDPKFRPRETRRSAPRPGDIQRSSADISKARTELGFEPEITVDAGLTETVEWYARRR
jgi:UDP-N-acetylglucosamine 4-epimerase